MNLSNLQRDQFWAEPGITPIAWSTTVNRGNSDGVVHTDVGRLYTAATAPAIANSMVGIHMQQPAGENTPYRVKVYSQVGFSISLCVGYNQGSVTGSNDTISDQIFLPIDGVGVFDEIINIKASSNDDPIYFGVYTAIGSSVFLTTSMSVQRLNTVPPRFAAVVS